MKDDEIIEQLRERGRLAEAFFVLLDRACGEDEVFYWSCFNRAHPPEKRSESMRISVAAAAAVCTACERSWDIFQIARDKLGPGTPLASFRRDLEAIAARPVYVGDAEVSQVQQIAPELPSPDERTTLAIATPEVPAAAPADEVTNEQKDTAIAGVLEDLQRVPVDWKHPPNDIEAELATLGAMLLDHDAAGVVTGIVRPSDFYVKAHGQVFGVMVDVRVRDDALDVVMLREELQKRGLLEAVGGTSFLSRIVASCPSTANAAFYARIVEGCARRRRIIVAAQLATKAAFAGDETAAAAALEVVVKTREDQAVRVEVERGESWGFDALMEADFPPPNLIWDDWLAGPSVNIFFGPSGAGKSWLVWALALGAALPIQGELLGKSVAAPSEQTLVVLGSEDPPRRAQDRFVKLLRSSPIPDIAYGDVPLTVKRPPASVGGLNTERGQEWLLKMLEETKARFLVLDTIGSLLSLKLSDGDQVMPWLRFLHGLRDQHGVTTNMNAHTRKGSSDSKKSGSGTTKDDLYGAQEWRAQVDGLVMFSPESDDEGRCWISREKDKDLGGVEPRLLVKLDKTTGRFEVLAGADGTQTARPAGAVTSNGHEARGRGRPPKITIDAVKEMLQQLGNIPAKDLPRRLGVTQGTWWNEVKDIRIALLRQGVVRIDPDGGAGFIWRWVGPAQAST